MGDPNGKSLSFGGYGSHGKCFEVWGVGVSVEGIWGEIGPRVTRGLKTPHPMPLALLPLPSTSPHPPSRDLKKPTDLSMGFKSHFAAVRRRLCIKRVVRSHHIVLHLVNELLVLILHLILIGDHIGNIVAKCSLGGVEILLAVLDILLE